MNDLSISKPYDPHRTYGKAEPISVKPTLYQRLNFHPEQKAVCSVELSYIAMKLHGICIEQKKGVPVVVIPNFIGVTRFGKTQQLASIEIPTEVLALIEKEVMKHHLACEEERRDALRIESSRGVKNE